MKYVEEFRDSEKMKFWAKKIDALVTKPFTIMEVCGGQTHSLLRFGIDSLLPKNVEMLHGPGCPVCVTPAAIIDQAIDLAKRPNVILATYGDMLRVPGEIGADLWRARAQGADVQTFYSPLDALVTAAKHPEKEIVFLAVGFETTAPAHALAVLQAKQNGISNFSLLLSHVLVPPVLESILQRPSNRVQGFLAAGHVCAIMGTEEYEPLAKKYHVPIVVTGFEPLDLLEGIFFLLLQLESGQAKVENHYLRTVLQEGNLAAQAAIQKVFQKRSQTWRGMGVLPDSGLEIRPAFAVYDARKRFGLEECNNACVMGKCRSGEVLLGELNPQQCAEFGKTCCPDHPLGATMVSAEGACRAYYEYKELNHG